MERKRPEPRPMEVLASRKVTPNMLRLTFGGPGLADYPAGQHGGYVKLMLPPQNGAEKPTVRTYTIRAQREGQIDVDFALHGCDGGEAGPATEWATSVTPGTVLNVGGPGAAKPLPEGRAFYLIAGDMTSLPAISVNLENLASGAKGVAVIEVMDEADKQDLKRPAGVELRWLVNPNPGTTDSALAGVVRSIPWPDGDIYAWAACEFSSMRALREYLHVEKGLTRQDLYISSYWKAGTTEDAHKVVKREDASTVDL